MESLFELIRRHFPQFAGKLGTLPEKDYFRFLDADVIHKRRAALEEYMVKIVTNFPTVCQQIIRQGVLFCFVLHPIVSLCFLLCDNT